MLFAQAIKPGGKALSVIYSTYLGLGLYDLCIQSLIMWWFSDSFLFIEPCALSQKTDAISNCLLLYSRKLYLAYYFDRSQKNKS